MFTKQTTYAAIESQNRILAVVVRKRSGKVHVQHAILADKDDPKSLKTLLAKVKRNQVWVSLSTEACNGKLLLLPIRDKDGTFANIHAYSKKERTSAVETQIKNDIHYSNPRLASSTVRLASAEPDQPPSQFLLSAAIGEDILQDEIKRWRDLGFGLVNVTPQAICLPNLFLALANEDDLDKHLLFADIDSHGCDFILLSKGRLMHHHRVAVTLDYGLQFQTELARRCERVKHSELAGETPDIILLDQGSPIELDHYVVRQWNPFEAETISFASNTIETCCKENPRLAAVAIGTALQGF